MEGRPDENNRSLPPNPFVSTVLIHPSVPSPPPPPSLILSQTAAPALCNTPDTPSSQNNTDLQEHTLVPPQRVKTINSSTPTTTTTTNYNSCSTLSLLSPHYHSFFFGGGMQAHPPLALVSACVDQFSLFCAYVFKASSLSFLWTTVHAINALERATRCLHCKRFYVVVLFTNAERRGGAGGVWCRAREREEECSGCRGKRRLRLMRSHPGNLVAPPSQLPGPNPLPFLPFLFFHLDIFFFHPLTSSPPSPNPCFTF